MRLLHAPLLALLAVLLLAANAATGTVPQEGTQDKAPAGDAQAESDDGDSAPTIAELARARAEALPTPTLPCPTCSGHGEIEEECGQCDGKRKSDCHRCSRRFDWDAFVDSRMELEMAIDPGREAEMRKQAAEALQKLKEAQETIARLNEQFGDASKKARRAGPRKEIDPKGTIRCPASCLGGGNPFVGDVECKVCKGKARVKCPECRGRETATCIDCSGEGRRVVPCPQCVGAGHAFAEPEGGRPVDHCGWCEGRALVRCAACDDENVRISTCTTCRGIGTKPCAKCAGTEDAACSRCRGMGEVAAGAGRTKRCDACKGRGKLRCEDCDDGATRCGDCGGEGQRSGTCDQCHGLDLVLCRGCAAGSVRYWTRTAEQRLEAEDADGAVELLEHALARARDRHTAELEKRMLSEEQRGALIDRHRRRVKDLESRLKRARKAAR